VIFINIIEELFLQSKLTLVKKFLKYILYFYMLLFLIFILMLDKAVF